MANEFHYSVSLSIVHPSADPKWITGLLTSLHPKIQSKAGTDRLDKDGKPVNPRRKIPLSHWLADLHDEGLCIPGPRALRAFASTARCGLKSNAIPTPGRPAGQNPYPAQLDSGTLE